MKTRVLLTFPPYLTERPLTWELVKRHDLVVNIIKASIDSEVTGRLLLGLDGAAADIKRGLQFLADAGVAVEQFAETIVINWNDCVHCGACIAACAAGALALDREFHLTFAPERCHACQSCVDACPVRAIAMQW